MLTSRARLKAALLRADGARLIDKSPKSRIEATPTVIATSGEVGDFNSSGLNVTFNQQPAERGSLASPTGFVFVQPSTAQ